MRGHDGDQDAGSIIILDSERPAFAQMSGQESVDSEENDENERNEKFEASKSDKKVFRSNSEHEDLQESSESVTDDSHNQLRPSKVRVQENSRPQIVYQSLATSKTQNFVTPGQDPLRFSKTQFVENKLANDRKAFIKKVYVLLCLELTWTVIFSGTVVGVPVLREGIKKTKGLVIASCVICVALVIAILTNKKLAKRVPYNYVAILFFCLFESYVVAFICAYYEPVVVFCAVLVTMSVALSLTFYAWKTKTDFTASRGILVSIAMSLLVSGFLMIFFYSHYASLIFCEFVVIIYSIFIVYDTQLIAGGRYEEITFDDYIIASLILFVDIVGLLVYILTLCIDRT